MVKLDHLAITVRDYRASRDWYVGNLSLRVEFEVPERRMTALQDDGGFTLFVAEEGDGARPAPASSVFQRHGLASMLKKRRRAQEHGVCALRRGRDDSRL